MNTHFYHFFILFFLANQTPRITGYCFDAFLPPYISMFHVSDSFTDRRKWQTAIKEKQGQVADHSQTCVSYTSTTAHYSTVLMYCFLDTIR